MVNLMQFNSEAEKLAHLSSLRSIPSINPKSYSADGDYQRLDYISHPEFGQGFVMEVVSNFEIKVFFENGEQILVQKQFLNQKAN